MAYKMVGPSSSPKRRFLDWRGRIAAALVVAIVTAGTVHADVRVQGDAGAVQVHATQSNVAEVLSALESAFRLRVNTSMVLDRPVSGTFTGSLAHVLSRILNGYNYFIRRRATELEVAVIGVQGNRTFAAERTRPPTSDNLILPLSEAVKLKKR